MSDHVTSKSLIMTPQTDSFMPRLTQTELSVHTFKNHKEEGVVLREAQAEIPHVAELGVMGAFE